MAATPEASVSAERGSAKERVVRAFQNGEDWRLVANHNGVSYSTARRAVLHGNNPPKQRGGVRPSCVKITKEVLSKLEEFVGEGGRVTLAEMCDRLHRELGTAVNDTINKEKRKAFVEKLEEHIANNGMIVYHDETNFNLHLLRTQDQSTVEESAAVTPTPSEGCNLHIQGGVSAGTGAVLLRTHEGPIAQHESARFVADLFIAALCSEEYKELARSSSIVIVTGKAPVRSGVEELARNMLTAKGADLSRKLVLLRLSPHSAMLSPIESCWSVLKACMRRFMKERMDEFLARDEYPTFAVHRLAFMKEAARVCRSVLTRRVVWREERRCLRACIAAEHNEDMELL